MKSCPRLLSIVVGLVVLIGHSAVAQSSGIAGREAAPGAAHPATFSLITDHEAVVSLDGLWRFHPGDDPHWASPTFDDSAWPLLRSDQPWATQGYANMSGFAWYRFTVQVPSPAVPLALLLPSILTDYEVFEDGKKVGGFGQMPPHGSLRFNQTFLYRLAPAPAGAKIQIAIRVWHHPTFAAYLGGGPRYGGALLGKDTLLENQFRLLEADRATRVVDYFTIGILNAVISITIFGLYLFRRSEREYLWFAILLLTTALETALTVSDFFLNFPLGLRDFLAETLGALGLSASLFFFSRVLEARPTMLWRAVLLVALLDPLNVALYILRFTSAATSTSLRVLFDLPIETYIIVLLFRRALAGSRNARLLFVPTILLYGTGILAGLLLLSFQLGWQRNTVSSISQWNIVQTPFPVQLGAFVQLIFIVALLAFLIRRFANSRAQEERYTADLEAARTLQHVLIPKTLPAIAGLDIQTAYHPAQEVGGDFYQILPLRVTAPNAQPDILIVLGDVAGKGVPAAMTVSLLVGALRTLAESTSSPAEILASLNRRLLGGGSGFTTCIAVRLSSSGTLTLANAGHLNPYRNGLELRTPPALPLGLDPDAAFLEQNLQVAPGDRLTLLTDGVPEATCRHELFGFDRTCRISAQSAEEIAAAAKSFGQQDDITVLTLVFAPAEVPQMAGH
jgi:phosphoserine phosphatase RsbU/P